MTPDPHPLVPWLTPTRRAWLYRVCVAVVPLLVAHGLLTGYTAGLWVGALGAVLSTGTAALHTPTRT